MAHYKLIFIFVVVHRSLHTLNTQIDHLRERERETEIETERQRQRHREREIKKEKE